MVARGLPIDHTTIYRWVQRYAPELKRRVRAHLKPTNDSWKVDETYSKVRGKWLYLYRALDSAGNTIDFMLSPFRHTAAAEAFLRQVVKAQHATTPRVINVDGNPTYPLAFATLQEQGVLPSSCTLRPVKYLNNLIEQDHRFIKRSVQPGLGFKRFLSAWHTLDGYETINQIRKGQVEGTTKQDILSQNEFIARAFGLAA